MFKELSSDVEKFVTPDHGCLIGWAKQGLQIISFCFEIVYFSLFDALLKSIIPRDCWTPYV